MIIPGSPLLSYLSISSYVGTVAWAKHYYGRIRTYSQVTDKYDEFDLERKMTTKEARQSNKKAGAVIFRPGDMTKQFYSQDEIFEVAKKEYSKIAPEGSILLVGYPGSMDPCRCLYGPQSLLDNANRIWEAFESNDGWEGDNNIAKKLCDEWDNLFKKHHMVEW